MKKRDLSKIFAAFLLTGSVLAGCGSASEEPKEADQSSEEKKEEPKEEAKDEMTLNAESQVKAYSDMKAELEKMKEDKEVNWDTVNDIYTSELQASVNEVNGEFSQGIEAAISGGKSGELEKNVARQIIDKLTQSYFYQVQKGLQGQAGEDLEADKADDAKAKFAEVKYLAENVFIPTAEKRDGLYELSGESSMVENINNGLSLQEEALADSNAEDFAVYKQVTDKSIYQSYYLASKSYAEKISKAVEEGNTEELAIMQAEGYGFLQAIKGSLAGGDEASANELDSIFSLENDPSTIDAEKVNSLYTKAIKGKAAGYHEEAAAAVESGDVATAKVEAMEGNMFVKMLEVNVMNQLGEEKSQELFDLSQKWFEAISSEKADEAKQHSEAILNILNQL
ncbi:hypothetical protein [Rossellomorea aquimaris]|uniref:hypothetical protein n=1 Tax=Rossellomorea aquimaris TaxID=189382 RepID=UPI0005C9925B|nr:hypothetical protein [Rossellomorea aquimaris]